MRQKHGEGFGQEDSDGLAARQHGFLRLRDPLLHRQHLTHLAGALCYTSMVQVMEDIGKIVLRRGGPWHPLSSAWGYDGPTIIDAARQPDDEIEERLLEALATGRRARILFRRATDPLDFRPGDLRTVRRWQQRRWRVAYVNILRSWENRVTLKGVEGDLDEVEKHGWVQFLDSEQVYLTVPTAQIGRVDIE